MKVMLVLMCFTVFLAGMITVHAQPAGGAKFEQYRQTIVREYGIDINDFKEKLSGGRADGKEITRYDLKELLAGIKVEQEHTRDLMTALEISMDHLEEIPDYYSRLERMEKEAEEELEAARHATEKKK